MQRMKLTTTEDGNPPVRYIAPLGMATDWVLLAASLVPQGEVKSKIDAIIINHKSEGSYEFKSLDGSFVIGPVEERQIVKYSGNVYVGQVKPGT